MTKTLPTWVSDHSEIPDPFGYGERAVKFLRALKHPKSRARGRAFELPRWQERIVRRIYGPCHEDGRRIVRNAVIMLPRGNRKTSLGAALALLHTVGPEKLPGGQILCAASDQKQARLAFDEAAGIAREHKSIAKAVRFLDYQNKLRHAGSGATLEAISSDAGTQHGRTPAFALVDELHAWKKRDLWDVIRSGMPKTVGSLMVVITTAGRGQDNVAWELVEYARKVARGDIDDPGTLPVLFETHRDQDWRDEAVWRDANPGLADGFPDIEGLRQLAREALNRPGDREAFRQLHLNVWLDSAADPFVEMSVYDEGSAPVDLDAMRGEPCWLGVDLSSSGDLTVVVAAWRDGEGFIVHPWFFCPEDNLRERQDVAGVPYVAWAKDGLIEATPGNVVDHRRVEQRIRELCATYQVREIAFDPALAGMVMSNLTDDGLPAVQMRQGAITMMPAIKTLEEAIVGRRFRHGGHPVLRWNFANIETQTNTQDHKVRFNKGKRHASIDGAVAAAMAVQRAASGGGFKSMFEDPDLKIEDCVW